MVEIKATVENFKIVPIDELFPDPSNTNTHPQEQIDMLVKQFMVQGFRDPLIVDKGDGLLVCGEGRLIAARKAGLKELPVIYQDFDSIAHKKAFITAHNATQQWSKLDLSKVNLEVLDLGPDFDISWLAIKDFVIEPIEKFEPQGDEDAVPEVVHPITRKGDIWLLGNHRLMCGDSTMIDDVEKLMNGEKADMVFTDPPYNQETSGGTNDSIGKALGKQGKEIESMCDFDPEKFLGILPTIFKKGVINALVFCNKDLVVDYLKWSKDSGFLYNILFWKKPNAIPLNSSYRPDVEYLLVFRKSGIFNNAIKEASYSKCLEYPREQGKVHPTMKPVAMIENQLQISSNKDSVVTDLFLGSGSTLIACEKTNRKCYGMELDEKYCDVIINRWQNYTGKKATLESTSQTYEELKQERENVTT